MDQSGNLDLSVLPFDEFVEFFFQRPDDQEYWYQDPAYQSDNVAPSNPEVLIGHATRLFSEFGVVARRYTLSQIDHGIWALLSCWPVSIQESLWNSSIPLETRIQCIRSMFHVYSDFVAGSEEDEMETCFDMWWDLLGDEFWSIAGLTSNKQASLLNQDFAALLDAMFDTLKLILELPDPRVQRYALHGLGHLHHPAVRPLVQRFIDQKRAELAADTLRWVEQCRDGTVM
jgi:hypothetical protein